MRRICSTYRLILGLLPAIILLAAACHKPEGYHAFHNLPNEGWAKRDTTVFTLPQQEVTTPCKGFIEIRHSGRYPYRSLWIVVCQNTADSLHFHTDTIECQLTDVKGHFNGTGLNDLYQKSFPLPDVILQAQTTPVFKIAHHMKDSQVKGITDIGIRLIPSPEKSR